MAQPQHCGRFWVPTPVAIAAFPPVMKAWQYRGADDPEAPYYVVSGEDRATYTGIYLILVGVLSAMCFKVHEILGAGHL